LAETKAVLEKPDYGIDAPAVLRNLFLFGVVCLACGFVLPHNVRAGRVVFQLKPMFFGTGALLLLQGLFYLNYVKRGKFRHRDFMLNLVPWRGDEQVLDVGCGRGLLLVGAAKQLGANVITRGHATGIDLWSNEDMGANSPEATLRNVQLEGVSERCSVLSQKAQAMEFEDASFDVIVSNLCLHNIYDAPTREQAVEEIARVLRPGGVALLSDYKLTREYAKKLESLGFTVKRKRGSWWMTYPPLMVVIARKSEPAS